MRLCEVKNVSEYPLVLQLTNNASMILPPQATVYNVDVTNFEQISNYIVYRALLDEVNKPQNKKLLFD